jgi:hypothetical protein
MPKYLSNTTFFSDNLGTYIANGEIETNKLTTNGDIILTGSITNGSNSITFTENTLYTNIEENFFIHGTGLIMYNGVNYNIGQLLSAFVGGGTIAPYPSITYDSSLNTTTFTGNLIFPATSISSASINNSDFATISTSQTLSNKSFSGTTIFSSIQLNDNLITSNGGTTILNSNLALVNFLSGTSSNINTSITGLQTKTTNMSFGSNITTFTGTMVFPTASISFNAIVGVAMTLGQNQVVTATKTFNILQNFTSNLRLDGSLLLSAGTITLTNSTLQKTAFISDVTSAVGANLTSLQNQINSINTDLGNYVTETELTTALSPINTNISTLQTNTQYISSTSLNTTILNTTNVSDLLISLTINGFSKGDFNNVITQCSSLTSNCQNQINDAISKANSAQSKADTAKTNADNAQGTANTALALATTANGLAVGAGALATTANTSANTANATNVAQQTAIDDLEIDVLALQTKTTQITYSPATGRTSVIDTLYCPYLEIGDLTSGFIQTSTDQITLAGLLRCNNRVEVNNTLELVNNNNIILEGIINQDNATPPNSGVNQFQAPTNFNNNVIITNTSTSINSATTQIGTNAVSTLNCNATAEFGGDITMSSAKNLRLKNIVPILLNDIYFGGEAGVHLNDDVVFNMKIEANRPVQISNTCQIGTTINRNTLNSYTTTTILDANTSFTITTPTIQITAPLVSIGQADATSITLNSSGVYIGRLLGTNYLYGTTYAGNIYATNLYSATGVLGMAGQVFQQF